MIPAILSLLAGLAIGALATGHNKSLRIARLQDQLTGSKALWRTEMSKLHGFLLNLGYESAIEHGVFYIYSHGKDGGDNIVFQSPYEYFNPGALQETLRDLPWASDWHEFHTVQSTSDDRPVTDPPTDVTPTDETPVQDAPTVPVTDGPSAPPTESTEALIVRASDALIVH